MVVTLTGCQARRPAGSADPTGAAARDAQRDICGVAAAGFSLGETATEMLDPDKCRERSNGERAAALGGEPAHIAFLRSSISSALSVGDKEQYLDEEAGDSTGVLQSDVLKFDLDES